MDEIVQAIREDPECSLLPPGEEVSPSLRDRMPADYRRWVELAGGALLIDSVHVLRPREVALSTPIVAMIDVAQGDISDDWVVIARFGDHTWYLVMDLDPQRLGGIYDGFWDIYASEGDCAVVATSFASMLEQILATRDGEAWWQKEGFTPLGDAYDGQPVWVRPAGIQAATGPSARGNRAVLVAAESRESQHLPRRGMRACE